MNTDWEAIVEDWEEDWRQIAADWDADLPDW